MRVIKWDGVELIKRYETLQLKTYLCPAGKLTIGYGHTGADVYEGQVITVKQAEKILMVDIAWFSHAVENLVKVPLNDNEFAALVSFAFNIGEHHLATSTLLQLLNAGKDCSGEFGKWVHANGKKLSGLVERREDERLLFLKPV